jgi:hypothetical protein
MLLRAYSVLVLKPLFAALTKRTESFYDSFPTFYLYFLHDNFYFLSFVRKSIYFSILIHVTLSLFAIKIKIKYKKEEEENFRLFP